MRSRAEYTRNDFEHSPLLVFYETTRACDLRCKHCRADAQPACDPNELTAANALRLMDQLTQFPMPPLVVFTGGDPMKRADILDLVHYAVSLGLKTAMTPSATPLVTTEAIRKLAAAGLHRLAVSLDGANEQSHDNFRKTTGSFARTLKIIADARACGLPLQINTTIAQHNFAEIDSLAGLLSSMEIELWSVFFLVPTGRGQLDQRLSADQCEEVFQKLFQHSKHARFGIKTTEAPHYRRFLLQQTKASPSRSTATATGNQMVGTNDGKGVMFVSHTGEIYPSGFLPLSCGKFPLDSVVRVYQQSTLFKSLRDSDLLGGKCGTCEYRNMCGGSRARAFAMTGDPLAEEPDCRYEDHLKLLARNGRIGNAAG